MEIGDAQFEFVERKETHNAIFGLRTLIERTLDVQKDLFLFVCFIDHRKVSD